MKPAGRLYLTSLSLFHLPEARKPKATNMGTQPAKPSPSQKPFTESPKVKPSRYESPILKTIPSRRAIIRLSLELPDPFISEKPKVLAAVPRKFTIIGKISTPDIESIASSVVNMLNT